MKQLRILSAALTVPFLCSVACIAQDKAIIWSAQEQPIYDQIRTLRNLPDDVRGPTTRQLALEIRQLPNTPNKVKLADGLSNRATEGDFGHDVLQEVATTLADALHDQPVPENSGQPADEYVELAELVKYEHVRASLEVPQFKAAMAKLDADDQSRQKADFTLTDIEGKKWTLKDLRGKVVMVNFWATWCPPCRKEMPDLESLYEKFKSRGFVILAISDEEMEKVKPFISDRGISYPILLDLDRKVNESFRVQGIPKTFVYDREGKMVAQSIDMRTQHQFLDMLGRAGLQ